MSTLNISTLPRLPASQLRTLLLSPTHSPDIAVIDVRDDDHIGGHIAGSTHVPSSTLDYRVPELVRTLQRKKVVVFHCMLSQQRGPSAALRYARERVRLLGDREGAAVVRGQEGETLDVEGKGSETQRQKVYVLEGGFQGWQQLYGEDKTLTEAYEKDIWE